MTELGLSEQLAQLKQGLGEFDRELSQAAYAQKTRTDDRSKIGNRVIWLYALTVGSLFLFIIISVLLAVFGFGECSGDRVCWQGPAKFMLEVVTTAILPVVTLVLGFYFGMEKGQEK